MSQIARWSYTAKATIWRVVSENDYGTKTFYAPIVIDCDYGMGRSDKLGNVGSEIVIKNTFWTEYALARTGDYILLGESTEADPIKAKADEIRFIQQFADTFYRLADDYAIVTAV